ncbi:MAG: hypothetical protein ACOCXJ_03770 [Planctomycetota bacterium]
MTVHTASNAFPSCFCAPRRQYWQTTINGSPAIYHPPPTSRHHGERLALKIQGEPLALDIHKTLASRDELELVQTLTRSIRMRR